MKKKHFFFSKIENLEIKNDFRIPELGQLLRYTVTFVIF